MKADWKELPKGDMHPLWAGYYVSLSSKGTFSFNRVTHQRMGEPDAVNILFDRVNSRIGLKPTSRALRNAYWVVPWNRCGGRAVKAYRLMAEYGIDLPQTVEFQNIEIDQDGVLILDLRMVRVSARALARQRHLAKLKSNHSSPPA